MRHGDRGERCERRGLVDPDEAICFGFFDGTVDELRRDADETGYDDQLKAVAPFVESVGTDGLFEIVEDVAPNRTG